MRLSDDEARMRLESVRVATLATVAPDGSPHLVPITFALDGGMIYTAIDHKPKTTPKLRRLRNIAGNPRVALLAHEYAEDWDELWWLRVDGRARIVTDAAAMRHPIDVLAGRYEQYRARRPDGPVVVIAIESWAGWAARP